MNPSSTRPSTRSAPGSTRSALRFALLAVFGLVAGVAVLASTSADGPDPTKIVLAQDGEAVVARLQVTGARELAAFDATLLYDAEVISPTGVVAGDFLPEGSLLLPWRADEPGRVIVGSFNPDGATATGDGHLATVTFARLATRSPRLRLLADESGVYDASGGSIAPPARIVIAGATPQRLWLPWLWR